MTTNTLDSTEKSISRENIRDIEHDPWYFGAYLNMARHNLFLVINHLSEKFKNIECEKITDDEKIASDEWIALDKIKRDEIINSNKVFPSNHILIAAFNPENKKNELNRQNIYNYITKRHYLPCVKSAFYNVIDDNNKDIKIDENFKELFEFLISAFYYLNKLRNRFTHFLALDGEGNQIKTRLPEVNDTLNKGLRKCFALASKFSLERYKHNLERLPRTQFTEKLKNIFSEENFEHLKHHRLFEDETNRFTQNGLIFFTCLFLEKKYANIFLKKITGFKRDNEAKYQATLKTYTEFCLQLPDVRLDSDDKQMAVVMDILNELQRCPKELYTHLTDEDKKKFIPSLNQDAEKNVIENSFSENEYYKEEDIEALIYEITSMRRKQDRFPYLALRYIDEFDLLPNIRFQITIGKAIKSYDKKIGSSTINRTLAKDLNRFGKLSDFEGKKNQIIRENKEIKEFEQYAPHYNIEKNKIAFKDLNIDSADNKTPTGFLSLNDLPKLLLSALYSSEDTEKLINDFIKNRNNILSNKIEIKIDKIKSNLNLQPASISRRLINENSLKYKGGKIAYLNKENEKTILDKLGIDENKKENLENVDNNKLKKLTKKEREYFKQIHYLYLLDTRKNALKTELPNGILVNQLPQRLIDYLLDIKDIGKDIKIHRYIKSIRREARWRINKITKQEADPQKKEQIKLGEIATFLARDILNMLINKELKDQITSIYYNLLQNKIAYFGGSKYELIGLCKMLGFFDKEKGHAFLTQDLITNSNGILDFYSNYLNAKVKWIESNLLIRKERKSLYDLPNYKKIPYKLAKLKKESTDFEKWLNEKIEKPVNLPTNLLDEKLKDKLKAELGKKRIYFDKKDKNGKKKDYKFSQLLSLLMKNDCQPFYTYQRRYKKSDNQENTIEEWIELDTTNLAHKELRNQLGKYADKNEKRIRFIQIQDRILKLACENALNKLKEVQKEKKDENIKIEFTLADIVAFSEKSILEKPYNFKQKIKENFFVLAQNSEEEKKEVEIYQKLKTEQEKKEYKGKKGYDWTIKDFGRFKRFVSDKRIPNLDKYFESDLDKKIELPIQVIEYELNEYDSYREEIFRLVFDLEKYIFEKDPTGIQKIELNKRREQNKKGEEVDFLVYCKWIKEKQILTEKEIELVRKIRNRFSHSQLPKYSNKILEIANLHKTKEEKIETKNWSICAKITEVYARFTNQITDIKT